MQITATQTPTDTITAQHLAHLPDALRRYLTYTGIIGRAWVETVHLQYDGKFRLGKDKPWMTIRAHQTYTTNPPSFDWRASFSLFGIPFLQGYDTYEAGQGHMFGKLAGMFTIFDVRGDEINQGTMVRYLNEMIWFPTAFLGENITCTHISHHAVDITLTDAGESVTARLYVDDEGRLMNFVAMRYAEQNGTFRYLPWSTPITEYGTLAGLHLPTVGEAVWHMPEGDLSYARLHIRNVTYKASR